MKAFSDGGSLSSCICATDFFFKCYKTFEDTRILNDLVCQLSDCHEGRRPGVRTTPVQGGEALLPPLIPCLRLRRFRLFRHLAPLSFYCASLLRC